MPGRGHTEPNLLGGWGWLCLDLGGGPMGACPRKSALSIRCVPSLCALSLHTNEKNETADNITLVLEIKAWGKCLKIMHANVNSSQLCVLI